MKKAAALISLILLSLSCRLIESQPAPAPETAQAETQPATAEPTRRPTSAPIHCSDDSCLPACLKRIEEALSTRQFEDLGGNYEGTSANLKLALYPISDGVPGEPDLLYVPEEFKGYQNDFEAHRIAWDYAVSLLPPDQLKWINEYHVFTDGSYNVLAWVNTKDPLDRSHWQLGIDIIDAESPAYFTYTLIHELGHIVMMNSDQIPEMGQYLGWDQNPGVCGQFSSPEGCSKPDSYINLFYQKFWKASFEEWRETVQKPIVSSDEELRALVHEFYSPRAEEFVREYAATNIHEDMAESFMTFVLSPKPAGDSIVEQKILFFHDFPELTTMRLQMIANVCSYTER